MKPLSSAFCIFSLTALTLVACQSSPQPLSLSPQLEAQINTFGQNFQSQRIALDTQLGEQAAPNEVQNTKKIQDYILNALKKTYTQRPMKRDVHAKHHGCVKAQFQVNNSALPPAMRVGVFAQNKSYPTWMRFSNGQSDSNKADTSGDVRGLAIKLMQVPGRKLMENQQNAPTQDFVMMNNREFFIDNLEDYVQFSDATNRGILSLVKFAVTHPRVSYRIYKIFSKKTINPLETEFFSATPYKLGNNAIKFKVRPCAAPKSVMPQNPGPNYLREMMSSTLSQGDACFDFMIQQRKGSLSQMPVEDATVEWPENMSPYVPAARIIIPKQAFESPQQMTYCENMSFTPWHSLPEHKPLGVHNRVRKSVYDMVSAFRHEFNGVQRTEPTDFSLR